MKKNLKNKKNRGFTPTPFKKKGVSLQSRRGFMMVEVLVAASIITVSIIAAMAVTQKSVYVSRQAFHTTQAGFLLEEGAENMRIARDNAWSNVVNIAPEQIGIFTRTVSVANVNRDNATKDIVTSGGTLDSGTKLVTVTVSWAEGGVTVTKTLQFYIMDIFS